MSPLITKPSLFCQPRKRSSVSVAISALTTAAMVTGAIMLTSCASTGNIAPQYVPPSTYQGYDCQNLADEYNRLHSYIKQAQTQGSTFATTGVGVGISAGRWGISPNISIGMGKSSNTQGRDAKLARLYGEQDAVVQSAHMKQCAFATTLKVYGAP